MEIDNLKNLPQSLQAADYQACCDLVVKQAASNPEVVSVYLMGGEWRPGISDLDLVIVYRDGTVNRTLPSPWGLSEKARFIFTHRYLSFSEKAFSSFYYLYPKRSSALRLIYGKEISMRNPEAELPAAGYQQLLAAILFDLLINKLLLFPKAVQAPHIDVRKMIGELYSLTYTRDLVAAMGGGEVGGQFCKDIKKLRQNWFGQPLEQNLPELKRLHEEGVALSTEIAKILDSFAQRVWGIGHPFHFVNKRFTIYGVGHWNRQKFLTAFESGYVNRAIPGRKFVLENFKMLLPASYSYFFASYATAEGPFSRELRESIVGSVPLPDHQSAGVREHVEALNQGLAASRNNRGLYKIPFQFGLFGADRSAAFRHLVKLVIRAVRLFI